MPKVGMPAIRKPQLIDATMEAINEVGLQKASVAMISRYAGVSPAIINHYFGGKNSLLEATMRSVLQQLSEGVRQRLDETDSDDVIARVKAIVGGNFDPASWIPRWLKPGWPSGHRRCMSHLCTVYSGSMNSVCCHISNMN
nr:transcriptional regulator BetI [Aliamphritea spongicola]